MRICCKIYLALRRKILKRVNTDWYREEENIFFHHHSEHNGLTGHQNKYMFFIWKNFLMVRILKDWDKLENEVVETPSF